MYLDVSARLDFTEVLYISQLFKFQRRAKSKFAVQAARYGP